MVNPFPRLEMELRTTTFRRSSPHIDGTPVAHDAFDAMEQESCLTAAKK